MGLELILSRPRAYRAQVLAYLILAVIGAGLWRWLRRFWLRRRTSALLTRRSPHPFEIPSSLCLMTMQGMTLKTTAESTAHDLDLFCQLTQAPSFQLVAYRPMAQQTLRQVHARVRAQSQQQSLKKGVTFFVFKGDCVLGSVGFSRLDPMTGSGELDLILDRRYWDQGVTQDLHLTILDYGFNVLHLQRVLCGVDRSNRLVRAFYEELHWDLVSVGRAGSPNMYNYVICRQKYFDETRAGLEKAAAAATASAGEGSPVLETGAGSVENVHRVSL